MDLALNNLQRLICHKIQTNKPDFFMLHIDKWFRVILCATYSSTRVICLYKVNCFISGNVTK